MSSSGAGWRSRPFSRPPARRPARSSIPTKRRSERQTLTGSSREEGAARHPRGVFVLKPEIKFPDQIVVVELVGRLALERDLAVHDHVAAVGNADRLIEVLL